MEKKLNEIKNKAILELSSWWGLSPTPGSKSTIITSDKKIYYYHHYYRLDEFMKENDIPLESLSKGIELSDKQYEKVITFIEKEVVNHKFQDNMIFDAGYNVKISHNGTNYNIVNNIDFENKQGLYNKAEKLIKKIEGEIKNEK